MGQPLLSGKHVSNWLEVEDFHAILTFGAAVLSTVQTRELTSIARNSAGNYTVTCPRNYRLLVEFRSQQFDAAGALLFPVVVSSTITTDGKFIFEYRTEAGTATDPDSGSKAFLCVSVSNHPHNDATI